MDLEQLITQTVEKVLSKKLDEFKREILAEIKNKKLELNYLTIEQTAEILKKDMSTVRRYMNNGHLRFVQPLHQKLTTREWIDEYLNSKNHRLPTL